MVVKNYKESDILSNVQSLEVELIQFRGCW